MDAPDARFEAELWRARINDLSLVRVRAQPSRVGRWLQGAPRQTSGSVLLHLQAVGTSTNNQHGHSTPIGPGEGVLCDPDQTYQVDFSLPYEMFVVELPVVRLIECDPGFDLTSCARHRVDTRRSQLLLAFLQTAWKQRACLYEDPDWRDCVSRTSLDLAMRAISQGSCDPPVGAPAALRQAVIGHIRENLADPELRTSKIARELRVSSRTVQAVFERLATTASGYILQRRLNAAAARLIDRRSKQSVTELAYEMGFADSAYFSRCFSRHYGVSPRTYRRLGGVGARSS